MFRRISSGTPINLREFDTSDHFWQKLMQGGSRVRMVTGNPPIIARIALKSSFCTVITWPTHAAAVSSSRESFPPRLDGFDPLEKTYVQGGIDHTLAAKALGDPCLVRLVGIGAHPEHTYFHKPSASAWQIVGKPALVSSWFGIPTLVKLPRAGSESRLDHSPVRRRGKSIAPLSSAGSTRNVRAV